MLIKTLLSATVLLSLFACHHPEEKDTPANTATTPKDTAIAITAPLPMPVVLKDFKADAATLIQKGKLRKGKLLTEDDKRFFSISMLDNMPAPEFKYRIVDTLYSGPKFNVLLIGREYENENKVWLAAYDPSGKMISRQEVYYDNAEGFLSISSVIRDITITITTHNDFEEKEKDKKKVTTFAIDNDGGLREVN